jgi:membrane-associated phospholipid phosphatase
MPWREGVAYAGLMTVALAVPYSQYRLKRHHASDVIVGSVVGAGTAAVFYAYQERHCRRDGGDDTLKLVIAPDPSINGFVISESW